MRHKFLLLSLLLLVSLLPAIGACPPCAPGMSCIGSTCTPCSVGFFCVGGDSPAMPCMSPANCDSVGLSSEPFCVWNVTRLAGASSEADFADGQGTAARFSYPGGLTIDMAGVVYVADSYNNLIRAVTPSGFVSTIAGHSYGFADGVGAEAMFNNPFDVATYSGSGIIYVADTDNCRIRKISSAGLTTTYAGDGLCMWYDGGADASFSYPTALTVDSDGVVYVAESTCIRIINPYDGAVTTLAGSDVGGYLDAIGTSASFDYLYGITVDGMGNLFVADYESCLIRLILSNGTVSTYAGKYKRCSQTTDGLGTSALFASPGYISLAPNGNFIVSDKYFIRMIDSFGMVTTLAGSDMLAVKDGFGTDSAFGFPWGVASNTNGNLYLSDTDDSSIRAITCVLCPVTFFCSSGVPELCPPGSYCPFSSVNPTPCPAGTFGSITGLSTAACSGFCTAEPGFYCPQGSTSPTASLICPIGEYCRGGSAVNVPCHPVTSCPVTGMSAQPLCVWSVTTFAGSGRSALINGQGAKAAFSDPTSITTNSSGVMYVADKTNNCIRLVTPSGFVSTLAGNETSGWNDGTGSTAMFNRPSGIATYSASGIIYVADEENCRVRKISLAGFTTTFAGNGQCLWADGLGTLASFRYPTSLSVDSTGLVYVADYNSIRIITPYDGAVTTLAGSDSWGYIDATGTFAEFSRPSGLALDGNGNVYVSDTSNKVIRLVHSNGTVLTYAASFSGPQSILLALNDNLVVVDPPRIRMITPNGMVTTIAGSESGFKDGYGTDSKFNPYGVTESITGTLYIADGGNDRLRAITCLACPAGSECTSGVPSECTKGSYCPFASFFETDCPVGSVCSDPKVSVPCPAGFYCLLRTSSPVPCPPGSYTGAAGRSSCILCPPGQLAPRAGSKACDDFCPMGTYRSRPGGSNASSCTLCQPGTYGDTEGSTSCTPCPFGTAGGTQPGSNSSTVCTPCSPGSFSSSLVGASVCSLCDPGTYSLAGASTCTPCPLSTFLTSPGATSVDSCLACKNGTSTLSLGSTSASQCIPIAVLCPTGTQPTSLSPIYNTATDCIPLICPPPLVTLLNISSCAGCPPGTTGSSALGVGPGCIPCTTPRLCPGLTSTPLYNFLGLQLPATHSVPASALLAKCPMATLSLPAAPASPSSPFIVYAQLLIGGGLLAFISLLYFALLLLRSKYLDYLKHFDLFSDHHEPPRGVQYVPLPYPTHLGGLCSLWAVILLVAYGTYLVQEFFSISNVLIQQSLTVLDDSLWTPPLTWSTTAPPWGTESTTAPFLGLQVRLLISGQPGACAAPLSWVAQGQGSGGWSLASTPYCTTASAAAVPGNGSEAVSQHVFSCPTCVLGDASALTATFAFSCQAVVLEAIAVPSYPVGTISTRLADMNTTTRGHPTGLLATLTWTVRVTPTQLQDNSKTALPWASSSAAGGRSPLGYVLSSQQLVTTGTPLAAIEGSGGFPALQPASRSVNITIALPLQSFVAVTQLTSIVNFANLLAQLLGITGLLVGFRVAFGVTETAVKRLASSGDKKVAVGGESVEVGESKSAAPGWGESEAGSSAPPASDKGGTLRQRPVHSMEVQEAPIQGIVSPYLGSTHTPWDATPSPLKEDFPNLEEGFGQGKWTGRSAKVLPIQPPSEPPEVNVSHPGP